MKTLGNIIDRLIVEKGWEDNITAAKINEYWIELFGSQAYRLVKIKSYKDKILVLQISDPTWKMEIMLRKNTIKTKINELMPNNPVQEIVIH